MKLLQCGYGHIGEILFKNEFAPIARAVCTDLVILSITAVGHVKSRPRGRNGIVRFHIKRKIDFFETTVDISVRYSGKYQSNTCCRC